MEKSFTPIRALGIEIVSFESAGTVCALADGAHESAVSEFARILTAAPTYDAWESARMAWRAGYASQRPGISAAALDKAWSRFALRLSDIGLDKPKAPTKAAAEKRTERAAAPVYESADKAREVSQAYATAAAMPADKRADTLKAAGLPADTSPAELATAAAKAWKAAEKIDKASEREKTKAADTALKTRRDTIRAFVKDAAADKLAALEALCDALNGNASAWNVIRAILPAEKMADAMSKAKAKRAA